MSAAYAFFRTIVRSFHLPLLRLGFAVGSVVAPGVTARWAATLFSTPAPSSRQRSLRATVPDGVREDALRTHTGLTLRTYIWGDPATQPYVLLVHGWSSHATRFGAWVQTLRRSGHAVVAFDQPAHGRSEGRHATLPAFIDALLEVARRHGHASAVIGHSLGATATALALARGLDAGRAVLIAPASDPVDAARRFARWVGMAQSLCTRMMRLFEQRIGIAFEELQAHRQVPHVGRPALIVHDLQDREVPWAEGERLARHWPQARLLTTQGLGHHRIVDTPDVLDAALRFLRGETVGERVVSSPNLPFGVA